MTHFTATFLHFRGNDALLLESALSGWGGGCLQFACSQSAAAFRFPSFTINFAMYLMPGVAWGALTLMTSTTTRTFEVAFGGAVGLGWIACFCGFLVSIILGRCILDSAYGLAFHDFRDVHPFSPPIPQPIAAIVCSRRGQ
ncbi:membrane-associated protein, putative [Bodo saltans]|uniref:Membrane-associated protein, putative n=1 Tax=Bodo saltans TaxID=75058 RepID=A0A0S4J4Q9_BODSA|nr:membrane-associated protein, putative [Bodo saltans]|eukprot:CUG71888.1 membrane-associated protein, putative [Bodo saltans]